MITIEELAQRINKPVSWVRRHVVAPRERPLVDWRTFDEDSDFHRVCALMAEINEPFHSPFIDGDQIVVSMSSDFAFIFNLEGKRV